MLGTLHNQFGFKTQSKTVYCGIYFDSRKGGCGKALLRDLKAFLSQGVIWGDGTNVTTSPSHWSGKRSLILKDIVPTGPAQTVPGLVRQTWEPCAEIEKWFFPSKNGLSWSFTSQGHFFFLGVKVFRGLQGATTHPVPAGPSLCTHNPGDRCSWTHEIRHLQLIPRSI